MGYRLNRLDEPVFMPVPKPMLTEFDGMEWRVCASIMSRQRNTPDDKLFTGVTFETIAPKQMINVTFELLEEQRLTIGALR